MKKIALLSFIAILVLLSLTILFISSQQSNDEKEPTNGHEANDNEQEVEYYWGVDSASYTDESLYQCVIDQFGQPSVWGRYLGDIEDVSHGLDADEVAYLHGNGIHILVIYNHFSDATGYENGIQEAEQAISFAEQLDIPEGVAIFGDIEPNYPVDEQFINGWYDRLVDSPYQPALYGVFKEDSELFTSFNKATEEAQRNTILWTAYPQKEITAKDNAPDFEAIAPEEAELFGWQYAINAETCNIDTNLFTDAMIDVLWKSESADD